MTRDWSETRCGHAAVRRSGYAAVIAMVFLVIGTSLAAGLYAMVTSSTAITANEQSAAQALGAAETGMGFMRAQLNAAAVASTLSGTDSSKWIAPLASAMGDAMNNTATLGGQGYVLPAPVQYKLTLPPISLGDGTSFTAIMEPTSDTKKIRVLVTGKSAGGLLRTLELDFSAPSSPVVYPLMARSDISSASNVNATGTKGLSYTPTPVTLPGGGTGDVLVYPGMPAPPVSPSPMDFPDNTALIKAVGDAGLKPISDPSTQTIQTTTIPAVYNKKGQLVTAAQTVTTVIAQNSCSIPPNSNPTLSGTINGIVYVQWPNAVTIGDSLVLNGTIVFERQNGKSGTSTLDIQRSSTIDRSMAAAFTALKPFTFPNADSLGWWSIIAPDVDLTMHNGTTWGTVKAFEGSLNIHSFSRQGGGNQVALNITMGGIVAESTLSMQSNGAEYLVDSNTNGFIPSTHLSLVATSYQELAQ